MTRFRNARVAIASSLPRGAGNPNLSPRATGSQATRNHAMKANAPGGQSMTQQPRPKDLTADFFATL